MPDGDEGRFRIALEDTIFDTVLGDSGSDFNAIDTVAFKKVMSAKQNLPVRTLQNPVILVGALKADIHDKFSASHSVVLTATIYISGSNIPV